MFDCAGQFLAQTDAGDISFLRPGVLNQTTARRRAASDCMWSVVLGAVLFQHDATWALCRCDTTSLRLVCL